jgi:hypothetical protein
MKLDKKKSGSALLSHDKHKTNHAGRPAFWRDLAYDLEGLGAVARQRKAEEACTGATSIRQDL